MNRDTDDSDTHSCTLLHSDGRIYLLSRYRFLLRAFTTWHAAVWCCSLDDQLSITVTDRNFSVGPTQPLPLGGCKLGGAWRWPLTHIKCRSKVCVELYLHSHIRIHGVV